MSVSIRARWRAVGPPARLGAGAVRAKTAPSGDLEGSCELPSPRILLSVNARSADSTLHEGALGGRKTDFAALQEATGAAIVDWDTADSQPLTKWLRSKLGFGPIAALLLFFRRSSFEVAWCFSEVEGLLLALLLKISRTRRHVFVIGIELLSWKCLLLLKCFRVWTHLTALLPTSTYQAGQLVTKGIPQSKVIVLPYQVDCRYFSVARARPPAGEPYIVAVGLESRDYETLAKAVEGLDVEVKVAGASLWAGRRGAVVLDRLPPNVSVGSYRYDELRDLYAGASLAVVPLRESIYQHGVTAIQEAMAMGLPVVATRTTGQGDVLVDRRRLLRAHPAFETTGGLLPLFGPENGKAYGQSGHYVPVGDAAALRRSIVYFLEHPVERAMVGGQGRVMAEELVSLEKFVLRAKRLIEAAWAGEALTQGLVRV